MSRTNDVERYAAVGSGVVVTSAGPNAKFKYYVADRVAPSNRLRAAEIALDVSITIARPLDAVWPVFKNFNVWMNRFGYFWERVPADQEDSYAYLGNKPGANDVRYGVEGSRIQYIVRKVIPRRLLYFDSPPSPIEGKDGVWTGHNVMSLHEESGQTELTIFMEHTWYSETMSIEELRAEGKGLLDSGMAFWRDYFVPDLISAIDSTISDASAG